MLVEELYCSRVRFGAGRDFLASLGESVRERRLPTAGDISLRYRNKCYVLQLKMIFLMMYGAVGRCERPPAKWSIYTFAVYFNAKLISFNVFNAILILFFLCLRLAQSSLFYLHFYDSRILFLFRENLYFLNI